MVAFPYQFYKAEFHKTQFSKRNQHTIFLLLTQLVLTYFLNVSNI